jgi:hypothetical protein
MQVEKYVVEIAGRMNLCGNALDVLRMLGLVLQFLDILSYRFGVHPTVFP